MTPERSSMCCFAPLPLVGTDPVPSHGCIAKNSITLGHASAICANCERPNFSRTSASEPSFSQAERKSRTWMFEGHSKWNSEWIQRVKRRSSDAIHIRDSIFMFIKSIPNVNES